MKMNGLSLQRLVMYFFVAFNIFACISNFYRMNNYLSAPSGFVVADGGPLSLSVRDGNCRCTVDNLWAPGSAHAGLTKTPILSCDCINSTTEPDVQLGRKSTSAKMMEFLCPVCHPVGIVRDCPQVECPPAVQTACPPSETVEVAKQCPGVPWYAIERAWHSPPKFPACTMDTCFDYSRCENMSELLVYTYDLPSPPVRYFQRFNESKYWTDDPSKACLFFVFLDTTSPWPAKPHKLPHWNGGRNHVLVTFADKWEMKNPPGDLIGNASIMGTIVFQTTYRPGFDIPIPLPGKAHLTRYQHLHPRNRKYFATFRGTRYLGGFDGSFRSSDAFRALHNGEDVVVATTCRQVTNFKVLVAHPEAGVHCDDDDVLYRKYGFQDLMNTTFGLAPAGRQPASYRLIEVMSAGAIPVLITDNYVKPFDMFIHWHDCLLEFPTTEMARIIPTLREMSTEDVMERQASCLRIYNEFLKDDDKLMETSMRALKERFMGVFPNFARTV